MRATAQRSPTSRPTYYLSAGVSRTSKGIDERDVAGSALRAYLYPSHHRTIAPSKPHRALPFEPEHRSDEMGPVPIERPQQDHGPPRVRERAWRLHEDPEIEQPHHQVQRQQYEQDGLQHWLTSGGEEEPEVNRSIKAVL